MGEPALTTTQGNVHKPGGGNMLDLFQSDGCMLASFQVVIVCTCIEVFVNLIKCHSHCSILLPFAK